MKAASPKSENVQHKANPCGLDVTAMRALEKPKCPMGSLSLETRLCMASEFFFKM